MKLKLFSTCVVAFFFVNLGFSQNKDYVIQNSSFKLVFNHNEKQFLINDRKTDRQWESLPMDNISIKSIKKISSTKIKLDLFDFKEDLNYSATVEISAEDRISFEITFPDSTLSFNKKSMEATSLSLNEDSDENAEIASVVFPPSIKTSYGQGQMVFSIRSCGTLIAQSDTAFPMKNIMVYNNIGHDMPWVGVFDAQKGDGLMVLAETPYNASIDLRMDGDLQWPQIKWHKSMQKWAYTRKVTYVFSRSDGYVGLAKLYRKELKQQGALNTFEQKLKNRPSVSLLKGAVLVWGSDGYRFAQEANALGVKHAIVYGRFPAEDITNINGLNYLTSEYENIMDCREGATGFMRDNKDKAVIIDYNGKPLVGWTDEYFIRSSVMSLAAVKKYVPNLLNQFSYTGRFIDVGPADLREDYHPDHTFDREQDGEYKRAVAQFFANEYGLVVGGEHGKAWSANVLDYTEGATSGSFWWEDGNKPGHLIKPTDLSYMPDDFVAYGNNYQTRIPLWSLVYHDCHTTSWYWGDTNGWYYEIAPEISDQKDITDILYGSLPMCWANERGYGWDRNRKRFLQTVWNTCNFQEKVAFEEMLSHEFLNEDKTLQRSCFKNGAIAVVNYSSKPQKYKYRNKNLVLAPYGFYAAAPHFTQSKLVEDDQIVTRIESSDFVSIETPQHRIKGSIEAVGRITVFKIGQNKWHIIAETNLDEAVIDIQKITNSKRAKFCRLTEVNDKGEEVNEIADRISVKHVMIPPSHQKIKLYCIEIIK